MDWLSLESLERVSCTLSDPQEGCFACSWFEQDVVYGQGHPSCQVSLASPLFCRLGVVTTGRMAMMINDTDTCLLV